jgi:hypothetical protein
MSEPKPAKCYCGSSSWGKEPETSRYTCLSCFRPLWMPIETAPKEGPPILATLEWVLGGEKDPLQVEIIEWDEEAESWYCANGGWLEPGVTVATHWMHLPDPPKLD